MTATVTSGPRTALPPLAAPVACGCCLLAGFAHVAVNDPTDGGLFLPCPFRTLTGWWCPGCGLTRATHHLVRGDLTQALRYNLVVVPILLLLATVWLTWFVAATGRSVSRMVSIPPRVYATVIAGLLAFAVVRNLPVVPGLRG